MAEQKLDEYEKRRRLTKGDFLSDQYFPIKDEKKVEQSALVREVRSS